MLFSFFASLLFISTISPEIPAEDVSIPETVQYLELSASKYSAITVDGQAISDTTLVLENGFLGFPADAQKSIENESITLEGQTTLTYIDQEGKTIQIDLKGGSATLKFE